MILPEVFQTHAPVLAVVIPLIASPLAMLFGAATFAFAIAFAASIASFILSLALLLTTADGTVLSYHIGGWAPPLGIEYRIDAANALVMVIVSAVMAVVMPYAKKTMEQDVPAHHHTLFFACMLLCFTGLMGVTATGDAFNVFVFLEISSLSTYVLVAMGAQRDKRALSAAYDYLVLGTIGATFFVIGLGMLYMATGTLNLADLSQRVAELETSRTVRSGFAFIVVGLGLKLAIIPLHRWLPGAYTFAPSAISALLAATATKVAVYVLLRFMFSVYTSRFGFERDTLEFIIMPLAVVGMFTGSMIAIFQVNAKRMLAYSSLAQIGYMLLGISFLSVTGLSATLVHMFNHALTKGALFMAIGCIIWSTGSAKIPHMAGLARAMPWTCAAIVIGGLSLIGVPGTAGFISKWVLLQGALEKGWWPVALLIVASSLLAVIYVWKLVETLYLATPLERPEVKEAPLALLLPTWVLVLATIWFGIDASFTVDVSRIAAQALLGGGFGGDAVVIFGAEGR